MPRSGISWSSGSSSPLLRRASPLALLALGTAFGLFAWTFRGDRRRFWERMTLTGFVLGTMALANESALRAVRPRGTKEIGDIDALRTLEPAETIGARLATIIGPAEELFWRGMMQRRIGGFGPALA